MIRATFEDTDLAGIARMFAEVERRVAAGECKGIGTEPGGPGSYAFERVRERHVRQTFTRAELDGLAEQADAIEREKVGRTFLCVVETGPYCEWELCREPIGEPPVQGCGSPYAHCNGTWVGPAPDRVVGGAGGLLVRMADGHGAGR